MDIHNHSFGSVGPRSRESRKLASCMEAAGFEAVRALTLGDRELSFGGPAASDVLEAGATRIDRLKPLLAQAGPAYPRVRSDLLSRLASQGHRSGARVRFSLGVSKR